MESLDGYFKELNTFLESAQDDLTRSLRVMLENEGIPVEQARTVYVDSDFAVKYSDHQAESIRDWEFGFSGHPRALLRKFTNRIPEYLDDYIARGAL